MRKCKIGIVGFGTVGSGIYKILSSEVDSHPILKEIEIAKIAVKDLNKKRDIELDNNLLTDDPFKLINDPSIDVIVEVMGGVDLAKDIILQSLKLGNLLLQQIKQSLQDMEMKYIKLHLKKDFIYCQRRQFAGGFL